MRNTTAALALALLLSAASCKGGDAPKAGGENAAASPAQAGGPDAAKLDADIERLERQVERNPADEDSREELAAVYVRRGNARRAAQQLKEALADYRLAMKYNLDNEEAIRNSAELSPLVEGTPEPGEYGEPAPLPISPNVTGEGAASPTPQKP
jgi:tetratricopeptide (TPR) repeat protein